MSTAHLADSQHSASKAVIQMPGSQARQRLEDGWSKDIAVHQPG